MFHQMKGRRGIPRMLQFSLGQLHKILKDFYTLTSIRIALFDSQFQEVFSYPEKKFQFCRMIRENPAMNTNCIISDKRGCMECARRKELVLYRCHAGLTEAVVPIFDKNGVMGYMFFGQILPKDSYEQVKKQLKKRYDRKEYPGIEAAIDLIPAKTTEELNAAATILQALTSYVMTNQWVTPGKSGFIRQLDRYIETHLDQNITVEALCTEFNIGRTRLYRMATDYLGCGLAEYIRQQKILQAQKMLTETDAPIGEIACGTGFSDYNHFSRVFRQLCGISARQYRKENKRR